MYHDRLEIHHGGGGPAPAAAAATVGAASAFRSTRAVTHDVERDRIDADRVAAEWALMYDWLRRDDEMAGVCGFEPADLDGAAEQRRIADLRREVGPYGRTFELRTSELQFWVRFAWISADRCSGRQHALQHAVVRHLPGVTTAAGMLRAAVDHGRLAMDALLAPQSVVTVLGPPTAPGSLGQLFATEQLLRPAGYVHADGARTGDAGYAELTEWVLHRAPELVEAAPGYPEGTFDTLPMVAVGRSGDVALGTCPPAVRHLVDLPWPRHPDDDATGAPAPAEPFACWPAVPLQTNFALDVAGQRYCVLFSGWYVDEEIAANLLDPRRYGWVERVGAAIHGPDERERLRRSDRLDEYRMAQIEIATLRAVRSGFRASRRRLNSLGASQTAFGRFHERYTAVHGCPPPNDTGWTANRFGSRYRQPSHPMPHVPQRRGAELARHWVSFRSLRDEVHYDVVDLDVVDLTRSVRRETAV